MEKIAKMLLELLTENKDALYTGKMGEQEALALVQSLLSGFDEESAAQVHKSIKPFQSYIDRVVDVNLKKKQAEVDSRLSEKEMEIERLKSSIPRPSDPEEIKKRLDSETDQNERRFLQLEYNNALLERKTAEIEAEKARLEKESQRSARLSELQKIASEKKLNIPDAALFADYEDAEERMAAYSEAVQKMIDEKISGIATKKYGATPQKGNEDSKPKMTAEEIAAIPDREARLKAYEDNGL